ncbi:MAG TPA: hypothetical protein DET40_20315 [Lentisphaeria bacterium]|nr:MAG: hypothetical protein A2X45_16450 [Lentisphaerae bacterium GWF2_50_93]HCE45896.1 hypothetical protein [Lentisphaeria bacterium]
MKKDRSWIRLSLVVLIVFSFVLSAKALQFGDFTYTDSGTAITITDYTGPGGAVDIPGTIDGKPVTSIGYCAFYQCTAMTSVTIPDSVTSIGRSAFSLKYLRSKQGTRILPESLMSIIRVSHQSRSQSHLPAAGRSTWLPRHL